jgi:hypothetical protein
MNGATPESAKPGSSRAALTILIVGVVIALVIAGSIAAVVDSALNARRKAGARQAELRREGKAAALRLAAKGQELIAEYLKRDVSKPWKPVKIDRAEIDPGGQLGATEGFVLMGPTLIGSFDPTSPPQRMVGVPLRPQDPDVKVMQGPHLQQTPAGLQHIPAMQIGVEFDVAGQPVRGSAWLIVPITE